MKYKNKVTGAVLNSSFVVKGKNWELVEEPNKDLQKLTKAQLSEMLDEKGIEYKSDQTKDELIELLTEE